ncbi:neutral zinc metallopeptidase [Streptosporangiaceae bacterium NEAU-GS5]|nr:neutral zinc metallopeptidase [Streptosporangiaceae bacterium NEAU-GS5]
MKKMGLIALAVLSGLLLAGTPAHADSAGTTKAGAVKAAARYPVHDDELTDNELYYSGELESSNCRETSIKHRTVASAKRYVTAIFNCLNRSWAAHFEEADLPFEEPSLGFITKPTKFCGGPWGDAAATYCSKSERFVVLLDKDTLQDTTLFLYDTVAHEYGHHIQTITGIMDAYLDLDYGKKAEGLEQNRRLELQAECLAGVFISSVWDSLDRDSQDWKKMLADDRDSGDEQGKVRDHGKGRNIAAWLDRGFQSGDPESCDTWSAGAASVA